MEIRNEKLKGFVRADFAAIAHIEMSGDAVIAAKNSYYSFCSKAVKTSKNRPVY